MRILLTGKVGIGKTTVCEKVIEEMRKRGYSCCGVLTPEVRKNCKRAGFAVLDIASGEKKILANLDGSKFNGYYQCGKYFFDIEAVKFGEKALDKKGDLIVADEIGPLELIGKGFNNALEISRLRKDKLIIVVREELKNEVLNLLGPNFRIFEINDINREKAPALIVDALISGER